VRTFAPDADGTTYNQFTPSAGNRFACVDEIPPNESDYVYEGGLNKKQTFEFTTGVLPVVKGIQVNNYVQKDNPGKLKIKTLVRSNSVDYLGAVEQTLQTDYKWLCQPYDTDPNDSNPWDQTKLESREFGLQITVTGTTTTTTTSTTTTV
jgi:hypothetical protein